MSSNQDDQITIREHLLGELDEDSRHAFEQRLLTDDELLEELLAGEDELVDQYLGGELSKGEAAMFENHFLVTSERRQKLRFGKAFRKYASAQARDDLVKDIAPASTNRIKSAVPLWQRVFYPSPLAIAAVAAAILITALGVWRLYFYKSDVDKGLVALNSAYRQQRPLEARITRFDYAPYVTTRGGEPEHGNSLEQERAERYLLDAVRDHPDAASYHALGKFYLTKKDFDRAIAQFEEALKADPKDAQIYADLGATYLERGKLGESPGRGLEDLARSLENLNKALQVDSSLLEAMFNRALSLEEQKLWNQAETAWQDYLIHDSTSAWAQEARRKLSELQQRLRKASERTKEQLLNAFMVAYDRRDDDAAWKVINESYNSSGCAIANQLLDAFLNQPEEQPSDGESNLRAFSYLADLELNRAGDSYHSDLARFYTFLSPAKRKTLAKVQAEMDQALDYFMKARSNEAINLYKSSRQEFEHLGDSAEVVFTDYRLAHSYVIQPDMEQSREIFMKLAAQCEKLQYRWLAGQTLIGLAHISVGQNQYSVAIEFSKRALALFQSCGYIDGLVGTLRQLSDEYQAINKIAESLAFLQQGLVIADRHFTTPVVRWGLYTTVAFNLDSLRLFTATAAYQTEALMIALEVQRPLVTSRSYAYLGATYGKLGNFSEAIKNLRSAYEIGAKLSDDPNGMEMMANSSLQLGDLYRAANETRRALESYDLCLEVYDKLRLPYFNYAAHRGKLLTYVYLQDDSAIQQELDTLLSSLEQYRTGINEESQRNSFFETQQEIYDVAINFAYLRKHDPQASFQYSEMSHARTLLDILQQTGRLNDGSIPEFSFHAVSTPLSLADLHTALPEDVQLIQYAVLKDRLLIWLVTREDFIVREIPLSKDELVQRVSSYLSAITRRSEGRFEPDFVESDELYNSLVAPVAPLLDKNSLLVFIPDKILNYVPFAALKSPETKHYLMEDYNIEISPSASVFINSTVTAATKDQREEERLLSIGNPSFDRTMFPNLQDLPSATREAESISAYYKSSTLLVGENAHEQQIKEQMKTADVVHLALHYVVDQNSEMLSELLLAKEPQDKRKVDGQLHAYEICHMKLPRTRLVVLSACQSGIDRNFEGEGAVSIARSFMTAGVPLVIASLWPVESNSTAELMVQFHKHRKEGRHSSVEALRLAQLDMLTDQSSPYRDPYYWAPFVLIGGYARY